MIDLSPDISIRVIYALWIILVIYLTVSAIGVKQETQGHLGQSFGLLFAIIAAFLLPKLSIFHFVNFAPVNPILGAFGIILCVLGMAFLVRARQCLGKNWSQTVAIKRDHKLVTSGPYRFVRHPMYSGGIIAAIGSAIVAGGAWVFLTIILGALFLWRVRAEDKLMEQHFPDEYPDYKKRTKALIPFVWYCLSAPFPKYGANCTVVTASVPAVSERPRVPREAGPTGIRLRHRHRAHQNTRRYLRHRVTSSLIPKRLKAMLISGVA